MQKLKLWCQELFKDFFSGKTEYIEHVSDEKTVWLDTTEGIMLEGAEAIKIHMEKKCREKILIFRFRYHLIDTNDGRCLAVIQLKTQGKDKTEDVWSGTVLWEERENVPLLRYLQLSKKEERVYHLKDREGRYHLVREKEILYAEAQKNYVVVSCKTEKVVIGGTMESFFGMLSESFLKLHRSYVINLSYVKMYGRYTVKMVDGQEIPIPEKKYMQIKKILSEIKN